MKYKRPLPPESLNIISSYEAAPDFHNYEKELKKLFKAGVLKPGDVSILNIAHDDWCDIYNRDRCNCNPTIQNRLTGKILNDR